MSDDIKKPNFFLIGAPKCGTTALSEYLRAHPRIFVSSPKELYYWSSDLNYWYCPRSLREYLSYFKGAGKFLAAGECTAIYLFSRVAVPRILNFNPEARFIVMLRNPIEMAVALHAEAVFGGTENVENFESAWNLQESRKRGENIPPIAENAIYYQYGAMCKLGEQLERLLQHVSRERVLIIFLEDLASDPLKVYKQVLSFLKVPYDGRRDFPPINMRKRVRSKIIQSITRELYQLKRALGIRTQLGALTWIRKQFTVPCPRKERQISPSLRREMREYFRSDIALLSRLVGRDLSHWQ